LEIKKKLHSYAAKKTKNSPLSLKFILSNSSLSTNDKFVQSYQSKV